MQHLDIGGLLRSGQDAVTEAADRILAAPQADNHETGRVRALGEELERLVQAMLAESAPEIGFVGTQIATGERRTYWAFDPIEGSGNLAHGLPLTAMALGLVHDDQPILGVIALPFLALQYWATVGGGAFRDHTQLRVSDTTEPSRALVAVGGDGSESHARVRDLLSVSLGREFIARAQGLRLLGCAAVDLVSLAEGFVDVSVTLGNRPGATAAGVVLAREAGALVLDADGSAHSTRSRCAVAVVPGMHRVTLSILQGLQGSPYWPDVPEAEDWHVRPGGGNGDATSLGCWHD